MELTWIDDFLALERTRNFTRAAADRCTTQSAYSRRIQRLEAWLGAPLFERDSRPVVLTPAGEGFLNRARQLREDMLDARRATMSIASHFKQPFRLCTTNTLATSFVPRWLIENVHSQYTLTVASIAGCLDAVRQGRAEQALVPSFEADDIAPPLVASTVAEDRLVLVEKAGSKSRVSLRAHQLTGPFLVYTPGTMYGAQVTRLLAARGLMITGAPLCESASAEALLAQVKAGLGAAWIPAVLLDKGTQVCFAGHKLDIPYKIVLVRV